MGCLGWKGRDPRGAAFDTQAFDAKQLRLTCQPSRFGYVLSTTDADVSAYKRNIPRPGYDAMLADLDAGKIDVILGWKLDRLMRRVIDFEKLWERCEPLNAPEVMPTPAPRSWAAKALLVPLSVIITPTVTTIDSASACAWPPFRNPCGPASNTRCPRSVRETKYPLPRSSRDDQRAAPVAAVRGCSPSIQ